MNLLVCSPATLQAFTKNSTEVTPDQVVGARALPSSTANGVHQSAALRTLQELTKVRADSNDCQSLKNIEADAVFLKAPEENVQHLILTAVVFNTSG